ncbi:MAG: hypothetical protein IT262_10365 [Saprospiraceae bacterium]|nr:hypothetical protein [Saprospiraceae bacterium]
MKNFISLLLLSSLIISCSTTNKIDWSNSFWGALESDEAYLYTADSLTSIVDKEITKGTILYFHNQVGDFKEVYTRNPKKVDKELRKKFRYYLYKPKYKKLSYKYSKDSATIYEIPFDKNQTYILGERGGCYYINKHGNKTYVNRSYCDATPKVTTPIYESKPTSKPKSSSNCNSVQCSGRTQKGARCRNTTTNCSG